MVLFAIFSTDRRTKCEMLCKLINISGANATIITSIGRSAIGYATLKSLPNILRLLLWSCEDSYNVDDNECSEPKKLKPSKDRTPDGMEDLQWEEEIQDDFSKYDANDEWSKLYM